MRDVALEVPLRPLPFGRGREGDDSNEAGVEQSRHPLDEAALAGGIPAFEQHYHPKAAVPDPLLELEQLHLEAAELLVIVLSVKNALVRAPLSVLLVLQLRCLRHGQQCSKRLALPDLEFWFLVKFNGTLTATPRGGGGTLVPVPRDVAAKLGLKGMPKIQAVIAGQPYRGSLMPMGDGTYCLGVLKSIQEAAGVGFGDTVEVLLELDTAPRTVEPPPDLVRAMARDKKMVANWEKLSFTNKKEMALSLEEAKKPETRERRLKAAIAKLRA